jgi:hypothetical protein
MIGFFCEDNDIPPKQTMAVSLAVEEITMLVSEYALNPQKLDYIDIRFVKTSEKMIMRIRYAGKKFNPIEFYKSSPDNVEIIGIKMILSLTKSMTYDNAFGINNLLIVI